MTKLFLQNSKLSDLFEDIAEKSSLSKSVICPDKEEYPFRSKKRNQYYFFCSFNRYEKLLYIKPTKFLVDFLADNMDNIVAGSKFFEIIKRSDDKYLILCKYNSIIGSRWLNVFSEKEINNFLNGVT